MNGIFVVLRAAFYNFVGIVHVQYTCSFQLCGQCTCSVYICWVFSSHDTCVRVLVKLLVLTSVTLTDAGNSSNRYLPAQSESLIHLGTYEIYRAVPKVSKDFLNSFQKSENAKQKTQNRNYLQQNLDFIHGNKKKYAHT